MTNNNTTRLTQAMFDPSLHCNPIQFANGLANSIRSNEAKSMLWILIAQSYGQLATVSLTDEWSRLEKEICS